MLIKNKKILFYIKDPNGGPARFLETINKLLDNNDKYEILTVSNIKSQGFFLTTKIIGTEINKQTNLKLSSIFNNIKNLISFYIFLWHFKPDVIFSLDIYANVIATIAHFFYPKKVFLIHSSRVNIEKHISTGRSQYFALFLTYLIKFFYKFSNLHICPSKGLKQQLVSIYGINKSKVIALKNPVDIRKIRGLSLCKIDNGKIVKLLKQNGLKLFLMARFDPQKNIELILKVLPQLKKINFNLFILGEGTLKKNYNKYIKHLALPQKIYFLGWKKNPYKYLRYADLFVLLSNFEGFSYSIIEAQILGIPVISSDVKYGPRELLQNGKYGILFKNSPKSLIRVIKPLLQDKSKLINLKRLSNLNIKRLNFDEVNNKYKELFLYAGSYYKKNTIKPISLD